MPFLRRAGSTAAAVCLVALGSLAANAPAAVSPAPIGLDRAHDYAVLGGTAVTSTGTSAVTGEVGVSPGTTMTGFGGGLGTVSGGIHVNDASAVAAQSDLAAAITVAKARSPAQAETGDLAGRTFTTGTYAWGATIELTGTVTLDAENDPDAVFILRAGSTLGTSALSSVVLANGAQACNVFWIVGTSATLGAGTALKGTLLAEASITLGDGTSIAGRALARDGAVTMANNPVAVPSCGPLSNTAPAITPFSATLTGGVQTVHAAVGEWSVTDPRGSNAGYRVTVAAGAATVDGSHAQAGTGGSLTLTPKAAVAASGNPAATGPVSAAAQTLGTTAATIATAAADAGQGTWGFPADSGAEKSLAIVIPGDASAGAYSRTLTFTTAPPAG